MPELPEVETTIRYIQPVLQRNQIRSINFGTNASSIFNMSLSDVESILTENELVQIQRHGKYMLWQFADHTKAVSHLRMSGRFHVNQKLGSPNKHTHFSLLLADGQYVHYIDQRRFGTFHFVDDFTDYPGLRRLGRDAWGDQIDSGYLQDHAQRRRVTIYQYLLDQSVVAGLGNIYVNEILHAAIINPAKPVAKLGKQEWSRVAQEIRPVLSKAIEMKGTTLIDKLYQDPGGTYGAFAEMLQVYGRADELCYRCGGMIRKEKIAGRSAYYCDRCQATPVL